MQDILTSLYLTIQSRKLEKQDKSYTCYLFEQGKDKILKKLGEECTETIIAAKNADNTELANEICDLLYHLSVLMVECDLDIDCVKTILEQRTQKTGNLKPFKKTDKNT